MVDHKGTEIAIYNRKIFGYFSNIWNFKRTLQNNPWVQE